MLSGRFSKVWPRRLELAAMQPLSRACRVLLAVVCVAMVTLPGWAVRQGFAATELAIAHLVVIPIAPVAGEPLLLAVLTLLSEPDSPDEDLPVDFRFFIEQEGRVLSSSQPATVFIPNGETGEIRQQFPAGPAGRYQLRVVLQRQGQRAETTTTLRIAVDVEEAAAITRQANAACAGISGGWIAVDPLTGEFSCACPPGTLLNAARNACEEDWR
jgi:hypothetical protein